MIVLADWLGAGRTMIALLAAFLLIVFFASWMTRGAR